MPKTLRLDSLGFSEALMTESEARGTGEGKHLRFSLTAQKTRLVIENAGIFSFKGRAWSQNNTEIV